MLRFIKYLLSIIMVVTVLVFSGCSDQKLPHGDFDVKGFATLTNWNVFDSSQGPQKIIYLDYANAINGFAIPSVRQTDDGYFHFEFLLRNLSGTDQKFYYNLYYQNESYKFPECVAGSQRENVFAGENFYGSRSAEFPGFAETCVIPADDKYHKVAFSIRIEGNPRNEKRYFDNNINQRWKRNPRTGEYSFLLVVSTKDNLDNNVIPDYIADVCKQHDSVFHNPFYFYLYGEGKKIKNLAALFSGSVLRVGARPALTGGIYVNPADFDAEKYLPSTGKYCSSSDELYNNAPLSTFVSYVDTSSRFLNIPVLADVINENYSLRDYNWNRTFHKQEEMVPTKPGNTDCPCSQLSVDTVEASVIMKNEATRPGEWKKKSIGVMTRHGFTYGKYTVKVKMTELLNGAGVWNGITNGIWLASQKNEPWNNCRKCNKKGYLHNYWGSGKDDRSDYTGYSEIDFEILKTVSYCPSYQFPPTYYYPVANRYRVADWHIPLPKALQPDSAKIMVCCTNWDMACPDPQNYDVGCKPVNYGNQTFFAHRWDYWYRSLTIRTPASDNELFASVYYYFQIEWKPDEIIWRIGPRKDNLTVVAYMNSDITCIPNNQMILIISQEFHDTAWWHGSPFQQGFIPFPKKDLSGIIYEITIE